MSDLGTILSRERIIAAPGFNRWLVPPAALAIHLCIGMAYGFSVATTQTISDASSHTTPHSTPIVLVICAWLAVLIPIGWGVTITMDKAVLLFK